MRFMTRGATLCSFIPWCFNWRRAANECDGQFPPEFISERDVVIQIGALRNVGQRLQPVGGTARTDDGVALLGDHVPNKPGSPR